MSVIVQVSAALLLLNSVVCVKRQLKNVTRRNKPKISHLTHDCCPQRHSPDLTGVTVISRNREQLQEVVAFPNTFALHAVLLVTLNDISKSFKSIGTQSKNLGCHLKITVLKTNCYNDIDLCVVSCLSLCSLIAHKKWICVM